MDPGYAFNTEEDIIRVVDSLAASAKDAEISPVTYVYDPRRMIQLGLWPASHSMKKTWVADWLEGLPDKEIEFWHHMDLERLRRTIESFREETTWKYRTIETLKREAIEGANSMALKMYAPELLYKKSKRPRTDMSLFRSPLSLAARREDVAGEVITIQGEQWNVVPVTRYALGMSKGLFYDEYQVNGYNSSEDEEFCGTFYYQENESSTVLAYKTSLRAFNKTDAANKLSISNYDNVDVESEMAAHMDGEIPRDLMMTPLEAFDSYGFKLNVDPSSLPQVRRYAGEFLGLYAQEDSWDQPLCVAAREAGYDIVILEVMVGSFQVVTEVLDTRSREDSFRSLVYVTG